MTRFQTSLLILISFICFGCSDESIMRSDKALTRTDASTELPGFPFPASAHSIYYLIYVGGMQDLEHYVRFEVDPEDLDSSVDALVAANNKEMRRGLPYPRVPISSASLPRPRKEFLPVNWWNPNKITTGYYRGHENGYALNIFIDQTHSRIYVYKND